MRKWLFTAAVLWIGTAAIAQENPDWNWTKLGKGVEYSAVQTELFGRTEYITAVRYKMYRHKTRICHSSGLQWADSTSALGEKCHALAAVNGSYFNMKTLEPTTYLKVRFLPTPFTTTPNELFRVDGVLAVNSRGKVVIFPCDTMSYRFDCSGFRDAIAAGPVLLQDGKPAREAWPKGGFFSKHHPRTLMGIDDKHRVYMIVIDGRFPGQGDGASIDETVQIAQMFGLKDAINLDGGGSCALWTPKTGVLSHPYDNRKFDHYGQRVVPNILYIQ